MEGPSHAGIGVAVGAVVGHALHADAGFVALPPLAHLAPPVQAVLGTAAMALVCGSIGAIAALVPDMDTDSTLGALLPRAWHKLTPGHRGASHCLLAVVAWWGATALACAGLRITGSASVLLPALFVAGVVSHLVADALTSHGIRPLYPFSDWHLRSLLPFRSGSWPEPVIVAGVAVLALASLVVDPGHLVALVLRRGV